MQQAWVQVAGLCVDFVGVTLIALEWLLAQRQELRLLAIAQAQDVSGDMRERMREGARRSGGPGAEQMERHFTVVARMEQQRDRQRVQATRRSYGGMRTGVVAIGMVLVLIGFVLQLLGTAPGCCAMLGIG
jgi:hypothetical protein